MSFGSQKLVHTDGTMHHLGIDAVTPRVILVPDPQEVPLYAALLEAPCSKAAIANMRPGRAHGAANRSR